MTKPPIEERYPLLLLYVEENGKKSDFPQRVVFADKGRGKQVSKGAAAIITQWPAQVTTCWLTSVAMASAFFLLTFILLVGSFNPLNSIHPRCTRDIENYNGNKSVHLVKHGLEWSPEQLEILNFIIETYPNFEINCILVDISKEKLVKRQVEITTMEVVPKIVPPQRHHLLLFPELSSIFFRKFNEILSREHQTTNDIIETEKNNNKIESEQHSNVINITSPFLKIREKRCAHYEPPLKTYDEILDTNPNIKERKVTYKEYFQHTPLQYYWMDLNSEMVLFAIRVQELWQNGGLTFYLPANQDDKNIISTTAESNSVEMENITETDNDKNNNSNNDINIDRIKIVIANTKYRYEILPEDNVSVDGQGLHMAVKIPCHTVFGEMLMDMQKNTEKLSVVSFIDKTLNIFCQRNAVDPEYCKKRAN